MPIVNPTIVVPGVTTSYLRDLYPLPPDTIWSLTRKDFTRARLHPDDLRYEAQQPALVRPDQVIELAYSELVEELRHNLSDHADQQVPVFPFSYDWRRPLSGLEDEFDQFIDEVIDRTRLLSHYHGTKFDRRPQVNLVAHSMGGLIVAGYLERFGAGKVDRVASLATPYRGSFEAIAKMATGTANIGGERPSSREREASRLTPSLYHLLPSFETGVITDPADALPTSTFDERLWQPSIIDTVVEYVRMHSADPAMKSDDNAELRRARGHEIFRALLKDAETHRKRLERFSLKDAGLAQKDWLCVIGVDAETRVRMSVVRESRGDKPPAFKLTSEDRLNRWEDDEATEVERRQTGDGTVHFEGAIPSFLPYESLICVRPDDFGYWEIKDRAAMQFGGFHGVLPTMNMLHRMIVRHLKRATDPRNNTWGAQPPGVSRKDWRPPLTGLKT